MGLRGTVARAEDYRGEPTMMSSPWPLQSIAFDKCRLAPWTCLAIAQGAAPTDVSPSLHHALATTACL
jgi:hypothetical protein